ncbi:MAG: nucleotidyltransferase domain-containing protein [Chthonomonadales bacterium]|nr:nucleotidyltransferase domain-containing protein [Chthonomonadales bacterium]
MIATHDCLPAKLGRGPVDIERLREAVQRVCRRYPRIRAAFVFGSQATGTSRADSDIDLALRFSCYPDADDMLELEDDLVRTISEEIGRDDIDLVDLNSANALLRFNATDTGIALFERNPGDALLADCISFKLWVDERDYWMRRARGERT